MVIFSFLIGHFSIIIIFSRMISLSMASFQIRLTRKKMRVWVRVSPRTFLTYRFRWALFLVTVEMSTSGSCYKNQLKHERKKKTSKLKIMKTIDVQKRNQELLVNALNLLWNLGDKSFINLGFILLNWPE